MTETPNTLLASRSDSKVLSPTLSIRNHRINYSLDWLHVNTENPTSLSLFDASFAIFALKGLQSASTCVISVSDDAGDVAPASGNSQRKERIEMIAQKQISATTQRSQLDTFSLRMTVAVLRKAISDSSADALTLWKVADAVCRCLRSLPQTDAIASALYWANSAMAYDDDEALARFCLLKAIEALTC